MNQEIVLEQFCDFTLSCLISEGVFTLVCKTPAAVETTSCLIEINRILGYYSTAKTRTLREQLSKYYYL